MCNVPVLKPLSVIFIEKQQLFSKSYIFNINYTIFDINLQF